MKKIVFFIVLVIASLMFLSCSSSSASSSAKFDHNITYISPAEFDGILEKSKGKVVVLMLFADWCVYCKKEVPIFNNLKSTDSDVLLYGIALEGTLNGIKKFADSSRAEFPIYSATETLNRKFIRSFKVRYYPTTIFYDRSGNVVDMSIGALSEKDLRALIEELKKS